MVPDKTRDGKYRGGFRNVLQISVPTLAREIESFLHWFNQYSLKATENRDTYG